MLEEISIKDLGIIQSATLPFTKGLTVITGETGAGKTMVLSALSLLLGKRSDSSIVRHGSAFASIEGCWNVKGLNILPAISEVGAVLEDDNLFMNRTVHKDGKSRAVVGGKTTPASSLATIGEGLVSIHGQSDQIRLKNTTTQREALDSYAGKELANALATYRETYAGWKALKARVKDLKTNMAARQREFEELTQALQELEIVNPRRGEDEELKAEIATLANTESLEEAARNSYEMLNGDFDSNSSTIDAISNVVKWLSTVSEYDPEIKEYAELAESIQININELSSSLDMYVGKVDTNALENLAFAQERKALLTGLIRKYGVALEDVMEFWETASQRVLELDPTTSNVDVLEKELTDLYAKLEKESAAVTKIRTKKALQLSSAVNKELAGLAMAGSKLQINLTEASAYSSTGRDDVSFLLKMPGASEARPLNKSASGGELSRIMLALEVVLADPTMTPTFIFDEVDSGVGGATAIEIGKRLSLLSREAQVIVVTHLPQVAAFADNHLRVLKSASDTFVSTDVQQLDEEARIEELARMLSGLSSSESGKAHAIELVEMTNEFKSK